MKRHDRPEELLRCEFYISILRDEKLRRYLIMQGKDPPSKGQHLSSTWTWFDRQLRKHFGGVTGPVFYVSSAPVPGTYKEAGDAEVTSDHNRQYIMALNQEQIRRLRRLLRQAARRFFQRSILLFAGHKTCFIKNPDYTP